MFKSLFYQFELGRLQSINRFLYSLLNFKPLRGQISEEWYVRQDIKRVLTVFAILKAALWDVIKKVLYFVLLILVPTGLIAGLNEGLIPYDGNGNRLMLQAMLWTFFCLNGLLGSYYNSHIVHGNCDEEHYVLLSLMRVDPKTYFLTELFWEYGRQVVYYTLFFLLWAVHMYDLSPFTADFFPVWAVLFSYLCLRPVGEAVNLCLCERLGFFWRETKKGALWLHRCYVIAVFLMAYGLYPLLWLLLGKRAADFLLFSGGQSYLPFVIVMIASAIAGVWAVRYLLCYPHYTLVARKHYSLSRLRQQEGAVENAVMAGYAMDEENPKKKEKENERLFSEKSGYDYLHAIFFHRHKKQLRNVVRVKFIVLCIFFGVLTGILLILNIRMLTGAYSKAAFEDFSKTSYLVLSSFFGLVVFLMYCFCSGDKLTGAMFYNCDYALLKYGFYRKKEAIRQSFWIRLKYMLRIELPSMGVFCIGTLVDGLLFHWSKHLGILFLFAGCACILTVFFSVVHLCMYYIFQPFTEGGTLTGFAYKFCTMAMWIFSYSCLQVHVAPQIFMLIVLGITVAVLIVGVLAVNIFSSRTFRLK